MAATSTSATLATGLRAAAVSRPVTISISIASCRHASTYSPPGSSSSDDLRQLMRRARPTSAEFFTGRPTYYEALSLLTSTLKSAQASLRQDHIYPLPKSLPPLQPPRASWISAEALGTLLQTNLKTNTHRDILELLNDLHALRHVADLSGRYDVVGTLDDVLRVYERDDGSAGKEKVAGAGVDELGRGYGMGRRKESSARVWMVPVKIAGGAEATEIVTPDLSNATSEAGVPEQGNEGAIPASSASALESTSTSTKTLQSESEGTEGTAAESSASESSSAAQISQIQNTLAQSSSSLTPPPAQILINHLPLPLHFPKLADREAILRPLRLTGLIGAYNIFALVRGGGTTGQSGAVGLAVARALAGMRDDVENVLKADGALMRDPRMVERKKTGKAKARKGYTWVKR